MATVVSQCGTLKRQQKGMSRVMQNDLGTIFEAGGWMLEAPGAQNDV